MKKILFPIVLIIVFAGVVARPAQAVTMIIGNDPNSATDGTPMGVDPGTGLNSTEFNIQNAYLNLFGAPSPNTLPGRSIWGETPTQLGFTFGARGDNVNVNTFQELDIDIFGDYWTLDSKLTFNPSTAAIVDPNDHILFEGTLQHFGKLSTNDFPHEGDDMMGTVMPFAIDLSAGDKKDALFGQLAHAGDFKIAEHPSIGHFDALLGILQARVSSPSIFFDEIEGSYTGILIAFHIDPQNPPTVPEPATMWMMTSGLAGLAAVGRKRRNI